MVQSTLINLDLFSLFFDLPLVHVFLGDYLDGHLLLAHFVDALNDEGARPARRNDLIELLALQVLLVDLMTEDVLAYLEVVIVVFFGPSLAFLGLDAELVEVLNQVAASRLLEEFEPLLDEVGALEVEREGT